MHISSYHGDVKGAYILLRNRSHTIGQSSHMFHIRQCHGNENTISREAVFILLSHGIGVPGSTV